MAWLSIGRIVAFKHTARYDSLPTETTRLPRFRCECVGEGEFRMRRFVLFALVVMIPLACSTQPPKSNRTLDNLALDQEPTDQGRTDQGPTDTAKSPEEKKPIVQDEWVQLFNGENLSNWKAHKEFPGNWYVANGILVGKPAGGKDGYLFSQRGD